MGILYREDGDQFSALHVLHEVCSATVSTNGHDSSTCNGWAVMEGYPVQRYRDQEQKLCCLRNFPDAYRCYQHIDLSLQLITQHWLAIDFRHRLSLCGMPKTCVGPIANLGACRSVMRDTADECCFCMGRAIPPVRFLDHLCGLPDTPGCLCRGALCKDAPSPRRAY